MCDVNASMTLGVRSFSGSRSGTHAYGTFASSTEARGQFGFASSFRYSHDLAPAATHAAICSVERSPARTTPSDSYTMQPSGKAEAIVRDGRQRARE